MANVRDGVRFIAVEFVGVLIGFACLLLRGMVVATMSTDDLNAHIRAAGLLAGAIGALAMAPAVEWSEGMHRPWRRITLVIFGIAAAVALRSFAVST